MADDINALKEEFKDLKDALMEYGIVANTAKKTGGSLEKGLGKLHATLSKSPFVQLTRTMKGYAQQLKLGFKLATNQNDMTPKEIKQAKEKQHAVQQSCSKTPVLQTTHFNIRTT